MPVKLKVAEVFVAMWQRTRKVKHPVGSVYKRYFPTKAAQDKSWDALQKTMKNKGIKKKKVLGHAP